MLRAAFVGKRGQRYQRHRRAKTPRCHARHVDVNTVVLIHWICSQTTCRARRQEKEEPVEINSQPARILTNPER